MREARINNGKLNLKGNKNNHKQNKKRKKKRKFPNVRQILMKQKIKIQIAILSLLKQKNYKNYMFKSINRLKEILIRPQINRWMIKIKRKMMKMKKFK